MTKLTGSLSTIKLGQPQEYENIKVYPIHVNNGHDRQYRTLNEAMEAKEVVIKEVSESGSVPNLAVENTGKLPVLIIVGEELIGAKQNRVLNTSLLVPAESELLVPVSCVEQGRWAYTSRNFEQSAYMGHAKLRMKQSKNVTDNLRVGKRYDAEQGEVWGEVTRKLSSHSSSSTTQALHDVYDQTQNNLGDYIKSLKAPDAEGILVVISGQIVGGDLFDHSRTLQELWPKLVRSYALDALESKSDKAVEEAPDATTQFLNAAQQADEEVYDAVGLGKDVRLKSEVVTGSSLIWENHMIHTNLFSVTQDG